MANETRRKTFLSYSRINEDFAIKLAKELKSEGFDVWFDQLDIPPGARWDAEVEKALDESEIFMVIITPASAKSDNVLDEIGYAIDTGKRILPVLLEAATLPLRLRRFQYVDFTSKSFNEGIKSAEDLLRTLIDQPTLSDGEVSVETQAQVKAEREATHLKKTPARGLVIGIIVAVTFGIAGIGYGIFSKNRPSNPSVDSPVANPATEKSVDSPATVPATETSVVITPTSIQPSPTVALSNTPETTITSVPINPNDASLAVFIQSALSGDMRGDAGVRIEHPLALERDSLIFVTPNYEGPESSGDGVYNDYPICVFFYGEQWVILNLKQESESMATMPFRAAFNVQILSEGKDAFIHTATSENTSEYWTAIDSQKYPLASDPNALVFATYNFSASAGSGLYNNHPIGVWYTGTEWAIFNRDLYPMPKGTAFNVRIVSPNADNTIVHKAKTSNNRGGNGTAIDNPSPIFHDPNLLAFAMPRVSAGSTPEKYDLNIGVYHNGSEWTIFNQDSTQHMPDNAEFNVLLLEQK